MYSCITCNTIHITWITIHFDMYSCNTTCITIHVDMFSCITCNTIHILHALQYMLTCNTHKTEFKITYVNTFKKSLTPIRRIP